MPKCSNEVLCIAGESECSIGVPTTAMTLVLPEIRLASPMVSPSSNN
jgi:hypothetical protein